MRPQAGPAVDAPTEHFRGWEEYWGELARVAADRTRLYGFENASVARPDVGVVPPLGHVFGFVASGAATVSDGEGRAFLEAGQWFSMPAGCELTSFGPNTRVVVAQKLEYNGLRAFGGPVERLGRLKYIDRCSDTLLAPPPVRGDPCLNQLHFPTGIEQTEHTHPSVRCGVIARGAGECDTPLGRSHLVAGLAFLIPADGRHRFVTADDTMDVIAYHPDSDWGPVDEEHPMVNRTLVDGHKIDNTRGLHAEAEVIRRSP
jgi:hypothetical protein